jgi:cleavage stimulation factor subunit 2
MRIVDPETAVEMLHRASPQVPPLGVPPQNASMNRPPPSLMPPGGGVPPMGRPEPLMRPDLRPPPLSDSFGPLGGTNFNDERRDPRSRDPRDRAPNGALSGPPPTMFNPRNGPPPPSTDLPPPSSMPVPSGPPPQLPPHLAGADPEKAQLIMQVLQLTEEQISMLPQQQRESIMILKEQINQGQR